MAGCRERKRAGLCGERPERISTIRTTWRLTHGLVDIVLDLDDFCRVQVHARKHADDKSVEGDETKDAVAEGGAIPRIAHILRIALGKLDEHMLALTLFWIAR